MVKASLGRLPNAPLAYVLGAVKFGPQLTLEQDIPVLQKRLQAEYPRYQPVKTVSIQLNPQEDEPASPSQQSKNHEFASADNRHGIILNRETLVFHATSYTTYEDFETRMMTAFREVGEVLKNLFLHRIGLRYIDVIIPDEDESPDAYVTPGLRCLPELSSVYRQRSGLTISEFQMNEGALVVRYAASPGRFGLPLIYSLFDLNCRRLCNMTFRKIRCADCWTLTVSFPWKCFSTSCSSNADSVICTTTYQRRSAN
ncbi:MAG: TIGR04255 family protein [Candidatus Competibacteraceae bacterium]